MVARWYQTCRGTWTLRVRNPPVVIVSSSWRIIQKHRRNGSVGCGGICGGRPRGYFIIELKESASMKVFCCEAEKARF